MKSFVKITERLKERKRKQKKECERLKAEILAIMDGDDEHTEGFSKASYKCSRQSRFSQKDFEKDYPALYEEYKKEIPVYRFLVS